MIIDEINCKVEEISERIIKFRREIHRNPELGGREKVTSGFVAGVLEDNDIEVSSGVGGYGVVGILGNAGEGDTIALRADMDALPISDVKLVDYTSGVPGVMHACGHDVHTAILMGTAIVLGSLRDSFKGCVKFIFQPSEEISAGGAKTMIAAGVLEAPAPSAIVALHVHPELDVGVIGHRAGIMTAAADRVTIIIKGRSGHASRPHQTVDAILVSAMVLSAIHHIVGRRIDPLHPAVISIGIIKGGAAENIVAERVEMRGTVRTLSDSIRKKMPRLIEDVVKGIATTGGARYEFDYEYGNPSVVNDARVDGFAAKCATELFGRGHVVDMPEPVMGAEDFSRYLALVPGTLLRLGTSNLSKGIAVPLHNPAFDIDERALSIGVRLMSYVALKYLGLSESTAGKATRKKKRP